MEDVVQVKGLVDREVKRRLFAALAWREQSYSKWLREQAERWLREVEAIPLSVSGGQEDREGEGLWNKD